MEESSRDSFLDSNKNDEHGHCTSVDSVQALALISLLVDMDMIQREMGDLWQGETCVKRRERTAIGR